MKNLVILFMLAFVLKGADCFAQAEDFGGVITCPAIEPEYVKHFQSGTNPGLLLEINLPLAAPGVITWGGENTYQGCPTPAMPITTRTNGQFIDLTSLGGVVGNLRATFNNIAGTRNVRISSTGALAEGEYVLTVRLTYSGADRVKNFRFIVRQPSDIVFVLDRSGSMECDDSEDAVGGWPACITGGDPGRRWDVLKESINNFVGKLDVHHILTGAGGDRLSVVYFSGSIIGSFAGNLVNDAAPFTSVANFRDPSTTVDPGPPPVIHWHIYNEMSASPVENSVSPRLATDGTSFGAGLVKSFGTGAVTGRFGGAVDPARRQVIILFTDGEQNTGNWVREAGMGVGKIIQTSSADMTTVLDLNGTAGPIEVYTAGITHLNAVSGLLSNIADGGIGDNYFNVLPGSTAEFGQDLSTNAFSLIFNQFSPQVIRAEKSILKYNSSVQAKYTCNKNVNRLIFESYLDGPYARRATYTIEKNGVDVTKFAQANLSDYIGTFIFNLYELPEIPSEGDWVFKVSNQDDIFNNNAITLIATADDEHVDFNGTLKDGKVHVGEKLKPQVTLSALGTPVKDAIVKAIIIKPGEDLGHVLALAPTPTFPPKTSEVGSCGDQKLSYLESGNPSALAKWKTLQKNIIDLHHVGNGAYEGTYDDVDVTGNYKVIYWAIGQSPDLGYIERMKEQTIHVRFAPVEINRSVHTQKRSKDGNYYYTLGFKPVFTDPDGNKRFLGPGYGNAILVEGAKFIRSDDNCDGSYEIFFTSPNANPNVNIWVSDEKVYSGRAGSFDDYYIKRKFNLSLHGGVTRPTGKLDSLYNGDVAAEIDLGWRFHSVFGAELIGGYYGFKNDFNIVGGTALLKAYFNTNKPLQLYIGAGGGMYQPKNGDLTPGGCLRLGAAYHINGRWSLGLDVAGFRIPDPDYSFGMVGGALRFQL